MEGNIMGKIKDKLKKEASTEPDLGEADTFTLTDSEFGYLIGLNFSRNNIINEFSRVMSGFLYYVAVNRLGYDGDTDLKFEIDFENDTKQLKIWKLQENLYNPTED